MKLFLLLSLFIKSTLSIAAAPIAMFSPFEGEKAFNKIYEYVEGAQETAHIAIYSWSDAGITKAMENLLKKNPDIKLRVVLHRPLARKESTLSRVAKLEKLGAMFKMAKMNMHEKSFVIDSDKLINSSANMSSGAKTRYSEDFVFIDSDGETENDLLISAFEKEFAILWNSADDIVSEGELQKADKLDYQIEVKNEPMTDTNMTLISSSMNFNYSKTKISSADYKKGRSLKMRLKKDLDENTYIIAKELIKAIDNAQSNILMSVNHFNLYSVSQALIRAVERGVDVKLYVDNQEFKTRIRDEGRKSIEMTPRFVRDYKKLKNDKNAKAPVRVKFYSHAPHHSSWFLNHHKYILIDYNSKDLKNTVLFSGSYNISKNAETKQFDNLVKFESSSYASLFTAYYENFMTNWNFNRTEKDKPNNEILSKYTQIHNENAVYIHAKKPSDSISLTWDEAIKLKKDIGKVAPGFFRGLFQNKGCYGYNIETKKYFGCR